MTRILSPGHIGRLRSRLNLPPQRGPVLAGPVTLPALGSGQLLEPVLVRLIEGRSGSTLLMELLGTSPDVCFDRTYPYEHRYLTYLCRLLYPLSPSFPADPTWGQEELLHYGSTRIGPLPFTPLQVGTGLLHAQMVRHGWTAFSECLAATAQARYYAEKFWNTSTSDLAAAGIPGRCIHLVRDPRDIVASIRAFDDKRGFYGFGRQSSEDEQSYLLRLCSSMKAQLSFFAEDRHNGMQIFPLQYEELVGDLATVADRLSDWLAVPLDAAGAKASRSRLRQHVTSASPQKSVGRWHTDLPDWQLSLIDRELGPELRELGYP
ncbi:MAG: sulfotransferase [Acidimicrobiales bacterium]